jgi:hypothetical protein
MNELTDAEFEAWGKLCKHSSSPEQVYEQLYGLWYYADLERKENIAKWRQYIKRCCTLDGWDVTRTFTKGHLQIVGEIKPSTCSSVPDPKNGKRVFHTGWSCLSVGFDLEWYTKEDACLIFDDYARKRHPVGYFGA